MTNDSQASRYRNLVERLQYEVRARDITELSKSRRMLVAALRVIYQVGRDVWEGQLTLRAMSLVYTTLLSLIPLLAISFSVLKGFGVHRDIEPFLITFLAPLGEKAEEITARFIEFIDNTSVSVLGYVGFVLLFYAVISLLQKIEQAFNYVWRVTRDRTFTERIRDYLTLVIIGPTLMFAATGIWASILGTDRMEQLTRFVPLGWVIDLVTRALPVLLIITAFSFIYAFVPNTKVHWRPAMSGGIVAGLLWNIGGVGFAVFVGNSANYPTIYSSFATAIFFMIWLYLAWMILLIGGSISFYVQNPTAASRLDKPFRLSNRLREKLALAIALAIGRRFYAGESPHTAASLTERLGLPAAAVDEVLQAFESGGLLLRAGDEGTIYVPARAWDTVSVRELINCIRGHGDQADLRLREVTNPQVDEIWQQFDNEPGESLGDVTLRDLAAATAS